jgi:hypothetical protein
MITTGVATTVAGGNVGGDLRPRLQTTHLSFALCLWRLGLGWNDSHSEARQQSKSI